jgi:hypothetical protein
MLKVIGTCIVGLLGVFLFLFILQFAGLANYSFFAPKYAAVQRQVYVQTPSFILGNQADLEQQARAYSSEKDPAQKAVLFAGMQTTIDNLGPDFPVPYNVKAIMQGDNQ